MKILTSIEIAILAITILYTAGKLCFRIIKKQKGDRITNCIILLMCSQCLFTIKVLIPVLWMITKPTVLFTTHDWIVWIVFFLCLAACDIATEKELSASLCLLSLMFVQINFRIALFGYCLMIMQLLIVEITKTI